MKVIVVPITQDNDVNKELTNAVQNLNDAINALSGVTSKLDTSLNRKTDNEYIVKNMQNSDFGDDFSRERIHRNRYREF